jgi:hypothetical protein
VSDIDPTIFLVKLKSGQGGIDLMSILSILPDETAPKTRSMVYATIFPDGISVEGKSEELIRLWSEQTEKMGESTITDIEFEAAEDE